MRSRAVGVLAVLLVAPLTAELLQAYLGDVGGPGGFVFLILFFAPFYGGIALVIREVSVRSGRGWSGRLLLAAAFGVAMPTVIDRSLFTPSRADVDGWHEIMTAATVGGVGVYAVMTWVGGHVLMSVGAPIAVGETLARRRGPWIPLWATALLGVVFGGWAAFVHHDSVTTYGVDITVVDDVVSVAVVLVLVGLAFSPLGRPVGHREGAVPRPVWMVALGLVTIATFDLAPLSWPGVAIGATVLLTAAAVVRTVGRRTGWTDRHTAALVVGGLLARTVTGFLAPIPPGGTAVEKDGQNVACLLLVLALGWAMRRRSRPAVSTGHTVDGGRSAVEPVR